MPFTFAGLPLSGLAIYYYYHGMNGKNGDFHAGKNFGSIKPIVTDNVGYPKYEPPNKKFRRMWIWK
jgi:hypothetical protein